MGQHKNVEARREERALAQERDVSEEKTLAQNNRGDRKVDRIAGVAIGPRDDQTGPRQTSRVRGAQSWVRMRMDGRSSPEGAAVFSFQLAPHIADGIAGRNIRPVPE